MPRSFKKQTAKTAGQWEREERPLEERLSYSGYDPEPDPEHVIPSPFKVSKWPSPEPTPAQLESKPPVEAKPVKQRWFSRFKRKPKEFHGKCPFCEAINTLSESQRVVGCVECGKQFPVIISW